MTGTSPAVEPLLREPVVDPDSQPVSESVPARVRLRRALYAARIWWRTSLRPRWHDTRPAVLLGCGVAVLVLGTIGFQETSGAKGGFQGVLDSFYKAIGLFGLGGGTEPPVPVPLLIARILGPLLTGYAALGTLLTLFREQARVLGIRLFVRHHVVIAGMGILGWRLAAALVDREPVVVIEAVATHERLPSARAHGVRVLLGQATEPLLLRRAGLHHARVLVAACGDDGTNVEVAVAAANLTHHRHRPLTVFVHLNDLDMWSSLAAEGAAFGTASKPVPAGRAHHPRLRIEYFNVFATAAQLMMQSQPPRGMGALDHGQPRRPHVLLVSLEGIGEQLVLQLARLWRSLDTGSREEFRLTLTGPNADTELAALRDRYPALAELAVLAAKPMAIDSDAFQSGEIMLEGKVPVSDAYVCLADEGQALTAALALHREAKACPVPVTVAVEDASRGVGILLAPEHGRFENIRPFGVITAVTSGELLLRGTNEVLARAQHEQWLRNEKRSYQESLEAGENPERNENMVPWERLKEATREDNRRLIDDLYVKLELVECMLVPMPLRSSRQAPFSFTDDELELLARREHVRWMESKLADGWTYGTKRDNDKLIHPDLESWEKLSEDTRDKDRNAVRALPQMLETAGFTIQRREDEPSS